MTDNEKKIFKAAIDIFLQKGFSAATTKGIACAAGVAEGTIFRYYKTKKDILNVIMVKLVHVLCAWALRPIEDLLKNTEGRDLKKIFRAVLIDRMKLFDKVYPMDERSI